MRRVLAGAGFLVAAGVACGDSTGVQPEDLAGTWVATSLTFTSVANPALFVEIVSLGFGLTIDIRGDGTVTTTFTDPGGGTDTDTGTFTVSGSTVTIDTDEPASGSISRDGDRLEINLTAGVEFDIDGNGSDEPATLRMELRKT